MAQDDVADDLYAVNAALAEAGIDTDDPVAGVRELAAQRDASYALIMGGALGRKDAQPPSDKAPAHRPWERCTMGVGCREAGTCYAAAHGEPERCDGEPAEAEPSAPDDAEARFGAIRDALCQVDLDHPETTMGDVENMVTAAVAIIDAPFAAPTTTCPWCSTRFTPRTLEPAEPRHPPGTFPVWCTCEKTHADPAWHHSSCIGRIVLDARYKAAKGHETAEPAPTRDESVPPPGWEYNERSGLWQRADKVGAVANAWRIYDAEHGYAPAPMTVGEELAAVMDLWDELPIRCTAVSRACRGIPDGLRCDRPMDHERDFHQSGLAMWSVGTGSYGMEDDERVQPTEARRLAAQRAAIEAATEKRVRAAIAAAIRAWRVDRADRRTVLDVVLDIETGTFGKITR